MCSHPPKSDPFTLQRCHQPTFNMFHVTFPTITPVYLEDSFLEVGQGGGGSPLITRLQHLVACAALLGYHLTRSRLYIPSFRTFFQAWSVSPPDFNGSYLVNHRHPVDSSQRAGEEHSSHFLFQPFLSLLRSPASAVTSPSSA